MVYSELHECIWGIFQLSFTSPTMHNQSTTQAQGTKGVVFSGLINLGCFAHNMNKIRVPSLIPFKTQLRLHLAHRCLK